MLMLKSRQFMILTYILWSYSMSYIDLWIYDAYVRDYDMIMLVSLILMSYDMTYQDTIYINVPMIVSSNITEPRVGLEN